MRAAARASDAFARFLRDRSVEPPENAEEFLARGGALLENYFGERLRPAAVRGKVRIVARRAAAPGDELLHCVAPIHSRSTHLGEAARAFADALRLRECEEATGVGAATPDASRELVAFVYRTLLLPTRREYRAIRHPEFDGLARLLGDEVALTAERVALASLPVVCADAVDDPVVFSPLAALGAVREEKGANAVVYAYAEGGQCFVRCLAIRKIRAGEAVVAHPLLTTGTPDPVVVDRVNALYINVEELLAASAPPFSADAAVRALVQAVRSGGGGAFGEPGPVSLHERREELFGLVARGALRHAQQFRVLSLISADPSVLLSVRREGGKESLLAAHNHLRGLRKNLPEGDKERCSAALRRLEVEIRGFDPYRPPGYARVEAKRVESLRDCLRRGMQIVVGVEVK